MLRFLVLLLLLVNGAYFSWSQGLLSAYGFAPPTQSEPQHLDQQIRPQSIRLLSPEEERGLTQPVALAASPADCLQSGLLSDAQGTALRPILARWPVGSWTLAQAQKPEHWIVYMGRYASAEVLGKKKTELRQRGVAFEALTNGALEPGLSLGGFDDQASADRALAELTRRGVRTAHVVQEHPPVPGWQLKLPAVDASLRSQLDGLHSVLAGNELHACRSTG